MNKLRPLSGAGAINPDCLQIAYAHSTLYVLFYAALGPLANSFFLHYPSDLRFAKLARSVPRFNQLFTGPIIVPTILFLYFINA